MEAPIVFYLFIFFWREMTVQLSHYCMADSSKLKPSFLEVAQLIILGI